MKVCHLSATRIVSEVERPSPFQIQYCEPNNLYLCSNWDSFRNKIARNLSGLEVLSCRQVHTRASDTNSVKASSSAYVACRHHRFKRYILRRLANCTRSGTRRHCVASCASHVRHRLSIRVLFLNVACSSMATRRAWNLSMRKTRFVVEFC